MFFRLFYSLFVLLDFRVCFCVFVFFCFYVFYYCCPWRYKVYIQTNGPIDIRMVCNAFLRGRAAYKCPTRVVQCLQLNRCRQYLYLNHSRDNSVLYMNSNKLSLNFYDCSWGDIAWFQNINWFCLLIFDGVKCLDLTLSSHFKSAIIIIIRQFIRRRNMCQGCRFCCSNFKNTVTIQLSTRYMAVYALRICLFMMVEHT